MKSGNIKKAVVLIGINLFYSIITIILKTTSSFEIGSIKFIGGYSAVLLCLLIYAILWQQVLKMVPLSTAFLFKGSGVFFVLLFSFIIFDEPISAFNIIGIVLIVTGIAIVGFEK